METEKRRKPAPVFTGRFTLNLPPETLARLKREAEISQTTVAGLARIFIARALAHEGMSRPPTSPARHGDEVRAA